MNQIDLNHYFAKYHRNTFFNQKTYADLESDVNDASEALRPHSIVALKIQSPYLVFVAMLASLKENKLCVLLSSKETEAMKEKLYEQIHFDKIIEDHDVEMALNKKTLRTPFSSHALEDPALVVFTSGTTSAPKGIALSLSNLFYSCLGFADFFKQTEKDCSLINLPHHHVGGLMILWRAFFSGGSLTTELNSGVDFISLVPLQLKRMLADEDQLKYMKKIRVILIGGSPLEESLKNEGQKLGLALYETYGMSETASLLMVNGDVLPYREIKLDENRFFLVKGKTLAQGYFVNNQLISLSNEWYKTRDKGVVDEQGRFHFKEREDLIFISGGENINPLLIEEITRQIPSIKDAYLIGLKDEAWGEIGVLLFETIEGSNTTPEEIKNFLKLKLHPHLIPKFFLKTVFNLNGQLKIKRSELKAQALELYLQSLFSYDYFPVVDAPLIVFLHGFMGDKEDLKPISTAIAPSYSRLFIDLPGHGQTKISHFYSTHDIFLKLSQFINFFSNSPTLYGYSMGGRVALELASHYLRPQKVILESAGLGLKNEDEQTERKKADLALFNNYDQNSIRQFLTLWYQNPIFNRYDLHPQFFSDCQKKSFHDLREWQSSQNFLSSGCFPLASSTLLKLSHFSFPMLYIYGSEDTKYQEWARQLSSLKSVALYKVMGAGHNPHKTHALEIADLLSNALK